MSSDSLGDRIKGYENAYRISLPWRMPVILRIDGSHFSSYTRGCKRPVDQGLVDVMNETAIYLCKNIQGARLAYLQSDEISILLNNYETLQTKPWSDNNLQKMVSKSAAQASAYFSLASSKIWEGKQKLAYFDSRAWVLPKEEVNNAFYWRQQDCTRNAIQMVARTLYSHKELNNKNFKQLNEMLFAKGVNFNDLPISQRRGRCIVKAQKVKTVTNLKTQETVDVTRSEWVVDNEIPVFSQDVNYIEKFI